MNMSSNEHSIPKLSGDARPDEAYDMRIARDGTWFYHGSPIGRTALVKLFASVLSRDEAGDYWLITPAERGRIAVEDSPFLAVEVKTEGEGEAQSLSFRTNLDEWVTASPDHPVRLSPCSEDTPVPYILVRDRLEARVTRAIFYELVALAVERPALHGTELGVWSKGVFFSLGTVPN
jgi:hypothetical protein